MQYFVIGEVSKSEGYLEKLSNQQQALIIQLGASCTELLNGVW